MGVRVYKRMRQCLMKMVLLIVENIYSVSLGTSLVAQMVRCLPTMRETWVQSLRQEDLLEKEMATYWRIPWTEEAAELQSMRSQRVRYD